MIRRLLAAVVAAANPAGAATNLIVDGSFETPVLPNSSFRTVSGFDLFPWFVFNGAAGLASNGVIPDTPVIAIAAAGRQFLDLRPGNFGPLPLEISQTVELRGDARYELGFNLGNIEASGTAASFYAGHAQLRLSIDRLSGGNILDQSFSHSGSVINFIDWTRRLVRFNGIDGRVRITFYPDPTTNDQFIGLDNVSLVAVAPFPEPGTWALMIAGNGFVGAAMRKQRHAAISI